MNTQRGHSLDSECSIEDAHVGVYTHDQEGTNVAFSEEAVDLRAIIGDHVRCVDAQTRMLTRPGFVELVRRIAPAAFVVDGERGIEKIEWRGRIDLDRKSTRLNSSH